MSTNKIEELDEALIRAGRADRIIPFTNTTKSQAHDMFLGAYTGERWAPQTLSSSASPAFDDDDPEVEDYTERDIAPLATAFAAKLHDEQFSPALVQQYFKDFRAQPRLALRELDAWMAEPRAYLKPTLRFPGVVARVARGGSSSSSVYLSVQEAMPMEEAPGSTAGKSGSAAEDLMSLDDLGGYEMPACFGRGAEENVVSARGPLLDVSLFAEKY